MEGPDPEVRVLVLNTRGHGLTTCLVERASWFPTVTDRAAASVSFSVHSVWQDTGAAIRLSEADSSFRCVARGSVWVRCCPAGTQRLCLRGRLDGWADLVLRGTGVFWVNIWCKTKTQAANTGQPSGGDPIVSPLPLRWRTQEEPPLCVPQLRRVLLLPPGPLTLSRVKFMEPASRSLVLNWYQTHQMIVTKHLFTLHVSDLSPDFDQFVSSQGSSSSSAHVCATHSVWHWQISPYGQCVSVRARERSGKYTWWPWTNHQIFLKRRIPKNVNSTGNKAKVFREHLQFQTASFDYFCIQRVFALNLSSCLFAPEINCPKIYIRCQR